jgi:hypothetical protein
VIALLVGEAPGPRGADRSAHPFWGDEAGKLLFKGLYRAGLFKQVAVRGVAGGLFDAEAAEIVPVAPDFETCPVLWPWSGQRFADGGILPVLDGVGITNAWAKCPTKDGEDFHRPTAKQMAQQDNVDRMMGEIELAQGWTPHGHLRVITLGTAAAWLMDHMRVGERDGVAIFRLPHPSPQGILSWRRKAGNVASVPETREAWIRDLFLALLGPIPTPGQGRAHLG